MEHIISENHDVMVQNLHMDSAQTSETCCINIWKREQQLAKTDAAMTKYRRLREEETSEGKHKNIGTSKKILRYLDLFSIKLRIKI